MFAPLSSMAERIEANEGPDGVFSKGWDRRRTGEGSSRGPEPGGGLAQQPIQGRERHAGKRQKVVNHHMLHTTCTAKEAR